MQMSSRLLDIHRYDSGAWGQASLERYRVVAKPPVGDASLKQDRSGSDILDSWGDVNGSLDGDKAWVTSGVNAAGDHFLGADYI